jgi:hypothetical protein
VGEDLVELTRQLPVAEIMRRNSEVDESVYHQY